MLTVLSGLADSESDAQRQHKRRPRIAPKQALKVVRKPKLTAHQEHAAIKRRDQGDGTFAKLAALRQERLGDFEAGTTFRSDYATMRSSHRSCGEEICSEMEC